MLDHDEVVRLYGPWTARTPPDAAAFLGAYPGRWWIAGGWAVDAYTDTDRVHADLDIGIPRADAAAFSDFAAATLDVWAAAGSLTPLPRDSASSISLDCGNLWLRASGADPWEYDVLLDDVRGRKWFYKRDAGISQALDDCLWSRDGITYLRPEIQLLFKAEHPRDRDAVDFERCLPRLDDRSRTWLAQSLRQRNPRHPWISRLASTL